jgi:hypothetical protein
MKYNNFDGQLANFLVLTPIPMSSSGPKLGLTDYAWAISQWLFSLLYCRTLGALERQF